MLHDATQGLNSDQSTFFWHNARGDGYRVTVGKAHLFEKASFTVSPHLEL